VNKKEILCGSKGDCADHGYYLFYFGMFQPASRNFNLQDGSDRIDLTNIRIKVISDCMYLCTCGYSGDSVKPCTCAHALITKYQKRISGPLLDRIDIRIEVPRVDYDKLSGDRLGESSEVLRQRVQAARDIQRKRFGLRSLPTSAQSQETLQSVVCNADMRVGEIRQFCRLQDEGQSLMRAAMTQLNLSARAYHRILKLSRTIADLAGCEEIKSVHLAEALQYRPKLMMG